MHLPLLRQRPWPLSSARSRDCAPKQSTNYVNVYIFITSLTKTPGSRQGQSTLTVTLWLILTSISDLFPCNTNPLCSTSKSLTTSLEISIFWQIGTLALQVPIIEVTVTEVSVRYYALHTGCWATLAVWQRHLDNACIRPKLHAQLSSSCHVTLSGFACRRTIRYHEKKLLLVHAHGARACHTNNQSCCTWSPTTPCRLWSPPLAHRMLPRVSYGRLLS